MKNATRYAMLLALATLIACKPTVRSTDVSTAEHRAAAQTEEELAAEHQANFDPNAKEFREPEDCAIGPVAPEETCWSVLVNPTSAHKSEAAEHRARAKEHRKAAARLEKAEDRACAGLAEYDRDLSPFFHAQDIESVAVGGDGVVVVFRHVRGLDREKLQRMLACHLARNAALGHEGPGMDYCPLVPAGVVAEVDDRTKKLQVTVRAEQPTAKQQLRHAGEVLEQRVHEAHHAGNGK